MKFKYLAPNEYNDLTSGFRWVESEYNGPHDFKIFVDKISKQIIHVEFDHDGHAEIHGGSDNSPDHAFMVYLHCHNPNHIALMAMICNHEDHYAENQVEVVCEKYNMVYQRHEPPGLEHTYDLRKCTVDENGVVTYGWWQMGIDWDMIVAQGKSHKNTIRERQRLDILTQLQHEKADYCCEIIDYVITNEISKNHPWKIAWPDIHTVSLDNSKQIGIPEDGLNGPRQYERTLIWGAVPHEPATHPEDENGFVEAICPVTQEEASLIVPWDCCAISADSSHKHMVDLHRLASESLILTDPNIDLDNDGIITHMEILKAEIAKAKAEAAALETSTK